MAQFFERDPDPRHDPARDEIRRLHGVCREWERRVVDLATCQLGKEGIFPDECAGMDFFDAMKVLEKAIKGGK